MLLPNRKAFKIGAATVAATVGVIFAITSVAAHSTPSPSGRSVMGSIEKAAIAASFPVFQNDPAPNTLTNEQDQDAIEAAEAAEAAAAKAAEEQKEAAERAAALAAKQAATACQTADQAEDAAERAADKAEDAAEVKGSAGDAAEDAAERAADKAEDAAEPKCHVAKLTGEAGKHKTFAPKTFSFTNWRKH